MQDPDRPQALPFKLFTGLGWLFICTLVVASTTGYSVALVATVLLLGSLVCGGLPLWWLTGWAMRRESRVGQFTVRSLLFVTLYAAVFLGFVRWIVVAGRAHGAFPVSQDLGKTVAFVTLICLMLLVISLPVLICMTEVVLWGAVWLLKRPAVRRWRRARRSDEEHSQPSEDS